MHSAICTTAALLLLPLLSSATSPATCSTYCKKLDPLLTHCSSGTETAFPACLCDPSTASENAVIDALNNCVVCNQDNLGGHQLIEYQSAEVICRAYDVNGNAAALSILHSPASAVIAYFSKNILPDLTAHAGGTGSGATPTPSFGGPGPVRTSKGSVATHSAAKTSKGSGGFGGSMTSSPMATTTSPTVTVQATSSTSTAAAARVGPAQLGLALGLLGFMI